MNVDESRADDAVLGIDGPARTLAHLADPDDDPAVDGDIGAPAGLPASIDHLAAANDDVVHESSWAVDYSVMP